jgi:hypothetical protein
MDDSQFDTISRVLISSHARRGLTRLLAGLAASGSLVLVGRPVATAKHKKHRKKHRRTASPPISPPSPLPVLTYQCPGPEQLVVQSTTTARCAQTFMATRSGALAQIQFAVLNAAGSSGDYLVELLTVANDVPTNFVLAGVSISNPAGPAGPATMTASFAGGPPLVAGTLYAAAISRPGGIGFLALDARTNGACSGRGFRQAVSGSGDFAELTGPVEFITAVTVLV